MAGHILKMLAEYYPDILKERYHVSNVDDIEEVYEIIGKNIGAIKHGEVNYDKVSKKIVNDMKMEYIKGVTFDR